MTTTIQRGITVGEFTFDVDLSGPEDGTPIVLLHGFPQTNRSWAKVTPILTASGLRVIAPNQRGYSPGARPLEVEAYASDHLVSDVLGLLDALDIPKVHLVGHDWGSAIAWQIAALHPDRVLSLTAVSVPHPAAFGWALREDDDQKARSTYIKLLRQEGKAERILLHDGARRLRDMLGTDTDREEYVRHLGTPEALTSALNWYRAMTQDSELLPAVTVPTTYVWSNNDRALGRAGALRCADYVSGPYRFVELDGISHWVPEEAPSDLAAAILRRVSL